MVKKILFGGFVLLMGVSAKMKATDYYVSLEGSDSNVGTSMSAAFASVAHAISVCTSGDDIYIEEGTYELTDRLRIKSDNNGTSSNRSSLQNYDGGEVILDFSGMATDDSNQGFLLNGSYWLIKGITIKGAGDNGMLIDGGSYNVIKECKFTENRDSGFQMKEGAAYNMIINCDSYLNYDPSGNGEDADGFAPKHAIGAGNYFYGCRAYDNSDDGWDMYQTEESVELVNCWAFANGYDNWDDSSFSGDGNAFKLGGNYYVSKKYVYRCVAFCNAGKGFDQNHNMGVITLINNTAYNNGNKGFQMYEATTAGEGHVAKNNICYPENVNFVSGSTLENNSWNLSSVSISSGDFVSLDTAGVRGVRQSDGSLPELDFLHLATTSEMVDAGVANDSIAYNGEAPDLGAFETGSTTAIDNEDAAVNKLSVDILGNPFYEELRFQITNLPTHYAYIKAQLVSITGKVMVNQEIENGLEYQLVKMDASNLPKGMYVLYVATESSSLAYKVYHR